MDERYLSVKLAIETHTITEFRQIVTYAPKTWLANDLNKNTDRMTDLIDHVEKLSIKDLFRISTLLGVDHYSVFYLISNQYLNDLDKNDQHNYTRP